MRSWESGPRIEISYPYWKRPRDLSAVSTQNRSHDPRWGGGQVQAGKKALTGTKFAGAWILDFSTSCVCTRASSRVWLCDARNCSPLGSSVCGIFQVRILECVVISYSKGSSQPRNRTHVSCIGRQILYHWATWEAPQPPEAWEISVCWLSLPVYGILLQ